MDGRPGHEGQSCNTPGGLISYANCHVTKANFPTVAVNLYNYNEVARTIITTPANPTGRTHKPYIIKDVGGLKVAVLGITSDVVPQQAQAFNTGFRFTMGFKELPQDIAAAQAEGAELIVVLSELGLSKNVQMVREFPEIDVMFSGHTHERTPEAIVIDHGKGDISIITEAGEDDFLGRLDVKVAQGSGKIVDWNWDLIEANSAVAEDTAMKALVDQERLTFLDTLPNGDPNPDFQCHTFGVNAFPFGKGHTLCESLDEVVGHTDPTIERFNAMEDIVNNANVDAFLELAQSADASLNDSNSLSTTNGFRFDVTILGSDDGFSGNITIGDLYTYYHRPLGRYPQQCVRSQPLPSTWRLVSGLHPEHALRCSAQRCLPAHHQRGQAYRARYHRRRQWTGRRGPQQGVHVGVLLPTWQSRRRGMPHFWCLQCALP